MTKDEAVTIINEHIPQLTVEDEQTIDGLALQIGRYSEEVTAADLAVRTCNCGRKIDGFYDYVDHLKDVVWNA